MIHPRRDSLLTALLLLGAMAMFLVLAWPLFVNEIFLEHDVGAVFVPLRWFYAQCLASGESFLWLPNIYMGVYLQGEGQTGMTHPLHWALYKFLPFTSAFDIELLLSYPVLFIGTVFWLRRWRLPSAAVFFGALLFTFSGYPIISWLWLVHVEVLAHTPWLLWCIDIAMRDRSPRKVTGALFGVTVLTASAILAGYPQMVYVSGLAEGMYALFLWRRGGGTRMLFLLFAAKLLGAACAAIQILPTLDLLGWSTRTTTTAAFRLQQSLHPMDLFSLVNPYLYHQRMYIENGYQQLYGGLTATLLVAWTILRWRRLGELRPLAACGLTLVAVGLVFALGKYGLVYRWVSMLPIIESFRGPARHGALFHVGWTLTAVVALTHLLQERREGNAVAWRELRVLAFLPVLSVVLAILIGVVRILPDFPSWLRDIEREFAPTLNPVFGAALMAVAFTCFALAAREHRFGVTALVLFTLFDLSWYGLRHRTTGDFEEFRASIDVPEMPPAYRIGPDWRHVYNVNGPLMKGYSTASGLVSIEPARALDYNVNFRDLQLAGAKWLRVRYGTNEELNVLYEQGIEWLELPGPMPRARLVSEAIVSDHPARDIQGLDYARIALVNVPIYLEGPVGEARVLEDRPGVIAVSTNSSGPNLLVLTEAYARGWRAEIDGAAAPIVRAYGDFQACVVREGEHTVRFTFDPASWRWGKRLTEIGITLAVFWHAAVFWVLSSRNAKAPPIIQPRSLTP